MTMTTTAPDDGVLLTTMMTTMTITMTARDDGEGFAETMRPTAAGRS